MLKDKGHLFAVVALFLAALVVFLVARAVLTPHDFGVHGHYRAGALEDNRRHPLVYAGHESCATCHDDVAKVHDQGRHEGVACEACHGPLGMHASDPSEAEGRRPDRREVCLGCHAASGAKPRAFPQIVAGDHAPEGDCADCHGAHRPEGAPGEEP